MSKKKQNREKIKNWKREQDDIFLKSLPFSKEIFQRLMDFLDIKLGQKMCQHNYKISSKFLAELDIKIDDHIDFFENHGGGCDCEILANMDELFEN